MQTDLVRLPNGKYTTEGDVKFLRQVLGDEGAREVLTMDGVGTRYGPRRGMTKGARAYIAQKNLWGPLGPEGERLRRAGYGIYQAQAILGKGGMRRASAGGLRREAIERGLIDASPRRTPAPRSAPPAIKRASRPEGPSWAQRRAQLNAIEIDPTQETPWYAKLVEQGLTIYQAERLRAENMRRIREGKAPLTEAQARALAPTANVNVALPPEIKYGVLILGAGILFAVLRRRR